MVATDVGALSDSPSEITNVPTHPDDSAPPTASEAPDADTSPARPASTRERSGEPEFPVPRGARADLSDWVRLVLFCSVVIVVAALLVASGMVPL